MRSIERRHFQWPWRTPNPFFKVTAFLKSNISNTMRFTDKVSNRKPHPVYRMVPLSMALSDLWPGFQGHDIFWSRISEKRRVGHNYYCTRREIPNIWNGTMFCNLAWPLNALRGFVSISWASCFPLFTTIISIIISTHHCSLSPKLLNL